MRDDKWLFEKLDEIWDKYFTDIPQENDVRIVWGRRARNRLGSIKQVSGFQLQSSSINKKSNSHPVTVITINKLFQDKSIPESVVVSTIAHELTHYAHGFHSPLEQRYATPHAGGIIDKEMDERGLKEIRLIAKKWLKENWRDYLLNKYPPKSRKRQKRRLIVRWI